MNEDVINMAKPTPSVILSSTPSVMNVNLDGIHSKKLQQLREKERVERSNVITCTQLLFSKTIIQLIE